MQPQDPKPNPRALLSRRSLISGAASGMGTLALASLLDRQLLGQRASDALLPKQSASAKRVIYLFMAGAPSQMDLFDHKPLLREMYNLDMPASVIGKQRFTTMTSGQARFPIAPSMFAFARHGQSGAWVSELLPHTAGVVDDLCFIHSLHTEAINHDPGITFALTGHEQPGRPSMGAWLSYGLGSLNQDLPSFMVLHPRWSAKRNAQALYSRLWGSAFLPSRHQGVALRSSGDPVLYLSNPPGVNPGLRRSMLDALGELNGLRRDALDAPEIDTRIAQYEMAYRMQSSVPELFDLRGESESTLALYGPEVHRAGSFAASCLQARRLVERDVRFVQIFHRGWDQHADLPADLRLQCMDTDQACAGLIKDLKQRGLLEDTLVVWAGEFGRTTYCQGKLSPLDYGRDHHPRCFTAWLAGGGVKAGMRFGATDDFGYNIVENPVHVHDLNATILHCLGIDHESLVFRHQGRDFRLTDVAGNVVREILV